MDPILRRGQSARWRDAPLADDREKAREGQSDGRKQNTPQSHARRKICIRCCGAGRLSSRLHTRKDGEQDNACCWSVVQVGITDRCRCRPSVPGIRWPNNFGYLAPECVPARPPPFISRGSRRCRRARSHRGLRSCPTARQASRGRRHGNLRAASRCGRKPSACGRSAEGYG